MYNNDLKTIHIHQLLHGYDEGHRMISGSIKPDGQSAKTLLMLSDLSGQGGFSGYVDYITGYPLAKMGKYALGKTWVAQEMPRPGCVWTHTLLIDFSDLAAIGDDTVLKLFRRPAGPQDILAYGQSLILEINTPPSTHKLLSPKAIHTLLKALYEFPMDSVFVQRQENFPADKVVMALWLQQWPRLRRNFRFCTWTPSDRSRSNDQFDLQFVPHKKDARYRKRGRNAGLLVDIEDTSPEVPKKWTKIAVSDVIDGNCNTFFRQFLWRYGAETDAGRAAFGPLAQIWQALEGSVTVDIDALIVAISKLNPAITSLTIRATQEVARYAAIASGSLPLNIIEFLLRNLALWGDQIEEADAVTVATVILRHAPEKIWLLFKANTFAEQLVANAASKQMQPMEVLKAAAEDTELFCAALRANLKLAGSPLVWMAPTPIPQYAANIVSDSNELDVSILLSMMEADNTDVPALGLGIFGQMAVNAAIEKYDSHDVEKQRLASRWLCTAKKNPELILTAIPQVSIKHIETLAFLASLVDYRYPSIFPSKDEWASALTSIENNMGGSAKFEFYAFLLGRALGGFSPEPGLLIHFSFDFIHNDLIQSWHPRDGWSMLEPELPETPWWNTWDRAYRVRLGVVNAFVGRNLPPNEFLEITKDEFTFEKLADIAASSQAGHEYLMKVYSWALQSNRKYQRHMEIISRKILLTSE